MISKGSSEDSEEELEEVEVQLEEDGELGN
jgi:hypothetical protein